MNISSHFKINVMIKVIKNMFQNPTKLNPNGNPKLKLCQLK